MRKTTKNFLCNEGNFHLYKHSINSILNNSVEDYSNDTFQNHLSENCLNCKNKEYKNFNDSSYFKKENKKREKIKSLENLIFFEEIKITNLENDKIQKILKVF